MSRSSASAARSIAIGSCGSAPVRVSEPRLCGVTMPAMSENPLVGSRHPRLVHRHAEVDRLGVRHRERRVALPEQVRLRHRDAGLRRIDRSLASVVKITGDSRWSCRFLPTPGRSRTTSMPSVGELLGRTDAGAQQDPRRVERSGGQHHLVGVHTATSSPSRSYSTPTTRVPSNSSRCTQAPVSMVRLAASDDRLHVRAIGAESRAVPDGDLLLRDPVEVVAVVVRVVLETDLDGRVDDRLLDRATAGTRR